MFCVVAVIGNTIRLAVARRRQEIEVMKLCGATNGFVRGPFVLEGMFQGFCVCAARGAGPPGRIPDALHDSVDATLAALTGKSGGVPGCLDAGRAARWRCRSSVRLGARSRCDGTSRCDMKTRQADSGFGLAIGLSSASPAGAAAERDLGASALTDVERSRARSPRTSPASSTPRPARPRSIR